MVDSIQADFNGGTAKLIWPVSLDGKKTQSETYKVLGILEKVRSVFSDTVYQVCRKRGVWFRDNPQKTESFWCGNPIYSC